MAEASCGSVVGDFWLGSGDDGAPITSVCFGTGRFLRSVLVPLLQSSSALQQPPVLIQTRGRTFLDFILEASGDKGKNWKEYPVETVNYDGSLSTDLYKISGAFSLGTDASRSAVFGTLLPRCAQHLGVIGVGVTERGLSDPSTSVMVHLATFLRKLSHLYGSYGCTHKISVVNTDNVPLNGSVLRSHMLHHASDDPSFRTFLETKVVFHVTMVDRIVSHRPDDPLVPRAEPFPAKTLVILDPDQDFIAHVSAADGSHPSWLVARSTQLDLDTDIACKLQVANGTHTALACVMAVCGITNTDQLLQQQRLSILLDYVDAWVHDQVLPASDGDAQSVWIDWRRRLTHAHFGLSTFFITQNTATKGGIRLGPTVRNLSTAGTPLTVTTAFCYASLLRFLTPKSKQKGEGGVYLGWLSVGGKEPEGVSGNVVDTDVTYADGLRYNLGKMWYEFRCEDSIAEALWNSGGNDDVATPIRSYLQGAGQLSQVSEDLVQAIQTLYQRMIAGDDPLEILMELKKVGFDAGTSSILP